MIPIQNETNIGNAIEVELYSEQNQRNHQIVSNRNRLEMIVIGSDTVIDVDIDIGVGFESKLKKQKPSTSKLRFIATVIQIQL